MQRIYLLSDATGETVERVVRAALTQFKNVDVKLHRMSRLRSREDISLALDEAAKLPGVIFYTLVDNELAQYLHKEAILRDLEAIDLITPLLFKLAGLLGMPPQKEPGLLYQLNTEYYKRMEAVDFTVKQDDGQEPRNLCKADIVLVGVSRTSKTPLSMYLAHKGYKVANVPLVLGIEPPHELYQVDQSRVVGLIIDAKRLVDIRSVRLRNMRQSPRGSYADYQRVEDELDYCRKLYRKHPQWQIIDVTSKSVEESAAERGQAAKVLHAGRDGVAVQPIGDDRFGEHDYAVESGTADASALPGAHALGQRYVVASWEGQGAGTRPGLVAVTAVEDGTTVGITPAAVKSSAGAVNYLKIYRVTNIARALQGLKKQGFWVAGLDAAAAETIYDREYPASLAIVVGSEGKGMRPLIRRECDFLVSIPMLGKVASLNVSVAGGVFFYELARPPRGGGGDPHGRGKGEGSLRRDEGGGGRPRPGQPGAALPGPVEPRPERRPGHPRRQGGDPFRVPPGAAGRGLRRRHGVRPGARDRPGRPEEDLQPLLHHQGGRDGARAGPGAEDRRGAPGPASAAARRTAASSITSSHASMHCVQWMHSIWRPSRMSMPVGQASTHSSQLMQSPAPAGRFTIPRIRGSPRAGS